MTTAKRGPRAHKKLKPRAVQTELRRLTHDAREKLHGWFRENDGTITYAEVQARIQREFGFTVGLSTLSDYYRDKHEEITNPGATLATSEPTTMVIRIEVPAGCRVAVSTETSASAEGAAR